MTRMTWEALLSSKRLEEEAQPESVAAGCSAFDEDVDRIAFSSAFRRMSRKTQVHPLAANDHVRARLIHSIEVARVGRILAKMVAPHIEDGLLRGREDDIGSIVEAACLAHDLGNPPFGHAGEMAMSYWFDANGPEFFKTVDKPHKNDLVNVQGNAQGFRSVAQTQDHLFSGGLRLTYATLGALLKYPYGCAHNEGLFGVYMSEMAILKRVATGLGLVERDGNAWCRHPLAFLVEAADDICYAVLDLQDAVELRILRFDDAAEQLLAPFGAKERERIVKLMAPARAYRVNLARIRPEVFKLILPSVVEVFRKHYDGIMDGTFRGELLAALPATDSARTLIQQLKSYHREQVLKDPRLLELELGSTAVFETLLGTLCPAAIQCASCLMKADGEAKLSWKSNRVLDLLGDHGPSNANAPSTGFWTSYQCLRRVIDYVSGMTDNYATYIARQLQGVGFSGLQRP